MFEKDPATGRIKWDPATKKPVFKKGVGFMDMQILLMFLDHEYEQILKGQKNLQQAAQLWFHQAFLGSGKFHGDAHSGNIMLASNRATFIDFGNMYELKVHYELGEDVPRASAEEKPDELDIIGTFDYMSRTDAGLKPEQAFEEDEQDLLYVMDENGEPTDKPINVPRFVNELHRITFQCDRGEKYGRDGEYELKVAARLRNAADPAAEALKIAHYTVDRLEDGRGQTFLKFAADFKKAWEEAKTPEAKEEAIKQFAHDHVSNTAMALRQKSGSAQSFYTANLEAPGGFAGVVMSTLFAESEAAGEMLAKNFSGKEQGKILASMKIISVKELGAGIFAGAGTIMNAIVEDTKKLGGDDSYQIDVGV